MRKERQRRHTSKGDTGFIDQWDRPVIAEQVIADSRNDPAELPRVSAGESAVHQLEDELKVTREELDTINGRLQEKMDELEDTNNDVVNLLSSTSIATVFLDKDLKVKRYTPAMTRLLSLIPSDVGRPIADVLPRFRDEELLDSARRVLVDLTPLAKEVQADDGRRYIRRITPYRTRDDRIEGVVITFVDVSDLKQIEEALRETHERAVWLARFPEENPNPVARVSADGSILYGNPTSAKLSGWLCEVGKSLPDLLLPLVGQAMTDGQEEQQDVELGGRFYSVAVTPFLAQGYANVYGRDITEHKRAEQEREGMLEEVRLSEQRLRLAQDAANAGTWEWDLRTNENFWSEEVWKLYGLEPNRYEASYETWRQTIHPDDRPKAENAVQEAARNGAELNAEWRVRDRDGAERWLMSRGQPLRDPNGQTVRYIGIVLDITDRKKAEQALLRAEQEWERTFDAVPDLIAILDDRHRILRANKAMAQRLGLTPEQCVGKICYQVVHGLDSAPDFCPHTLSLADGREHMVEVHEDCLGGDFLISTTPLSDEQGRRIGSVHVARDITERKQAERNLQVRTRELEHLTETLEQRVQERTAELAKTNEALRRLSTRLLSAQEEERKRIAGELHDSIGASLSGIKFRVEKALQQLGRTESAATESLDTIIPVIQEAVEECRRIQMDLRPSMLDDLGLQATLSWFCRRFQKIYSEIQVEQEIDVEEGDVPSPLKVVAFRVIQEAMNNVAKHSQANHVRLSLRKLEGRMELVLEDNGRGFNVDRTRSQEAGERGLGLLSMRERTELSGGSFAIESAEGKGTAIRASWPLVKEQEEQCECQ